MAREGAHLLRSGPPRNLCSGRLEQEPELVISSELGHRRAGHYQERSPLGAVINGPDVSPQTLLVGQAGSKHSASLASPVIAGLVMALVRAPEGLDQLRCLGFSGGGSQERLWLQ